MLNVGERIRECREKLNMTQDELARLTGYKSRSSINKIEKGGNDLPQSKIVLFAKALKTTPSYLMGWEPAQMNKLIYVSDPKKISKALENAAIKLVTDNTYYIPIYESVSAGFGAYASDYIVDYTPLSINSPEEAQNTMVIIVEGNSMYPKIENGDQIQVLKQDWAENGDIVVVLIDDSDAVVKKYECDMESETVTLISINPEYAPRIFKGKEVERLRILGVVKKVIKEL